MKIKRPVSFILGVLLTALACYIFIFQRAAMGVIPLFFGGSLLYLGMSNSRIATLVFGHTAVIIGCGMVTWGIYLLPHSEPVFLHIIFRPLFWGLFSIFGGICAIYHGFCRCVMNRSGE